MRKRKFINHSNTELRIDLVRDIENKAFIEILQIMNGGNRKLWISIYALLRDYNMNYMNH